MNTARLADTREKLSIWTLCQRDSPLSWLLWSHVRKCFRERTGSFKDDQICPMFREMWPASSCVVDSVVYTVWTSLFQSSFVFIRGLLKVSVVFRISWLKMNTNFWLYLKLSLTSVWYLDGLLCSSPEKEEFLDLVSMLFHQWFYHGDSVTALSAPKEDWLCESRVPTIRKHERGAAASRLIWKTHSSRLVSFLQEQAHSELDAPCQYTPYISYRHPECLSGHVKVRFGHPVDHDLTET